MNDDAGILALMLLAPCKLQQRALKNLRKSEICPEDATMRRNIKPGTQHPISEQNLRGAARAGGRHSERQWHRGAATHSLTSRFGTAEAHVTELAQPH